MASSWEHSWDDNGLYVQRYRQGKPVLVMLHGIGDWSETLRPLADLLNDQFDCLIPDLRGHGYSPRPGAYRAVDYAEDLIPLLSNLNEPFFLYGHSLGGLLALWLAGNTSEFVRGCILEDPPLFHLRQSIHQRPDIVNAFTGMSELLKQDLNPYDLLKSLETMFPGRPLSTLRQRARDLQRMDQRVWDPIIADQLCAGLPDPSHWPSVNVPIHVLMADPAKGAAMRNGDEQALRPRCGNLTVQPVMGVGHRIHGKHAQTVASSCLKLLQAVT